MSASRKIALGLFRNSAARRFQLPVRLTAAIPGAILALMCAAAPLSGVAQVNVTTYHNDIGRTGQNLNETALTPANVNTTLFGKIFSQAVDGQIYAQPLYMSGVMINGVSHNVVYVATEHDSVYAFDADTNGGTNSAPLWKASFLTATYGAPSGATTVGSSVVGYDITPEIGITGTPVIDASTGTLYVVGKTWESKKAVQRLHALDIATGAEKFGAPVVISASVPGTGNGSVNGTLTFDPLWESNRPGLLLLNGIVYIGYAAHGDNGPWHGWILGYNASTLTQTGAYCASPNGTGGGFWMSGEGLAADQIDPVNHPFGRIFAPTGNGDYNASKPYTNSMDYGDSHLALDLTNGVPTIVDEFTTNQQATLNSMDGDIASGGLMVVPTQSTGSYPHLAVQTGKGGTFYVLNRDNMGGYNTTTDQALQEKAYAVGNVGAWSTPAYWNGNIYWWGRFDFLKSFPLVNGVVGNPTSTSTNQFGYPGATPSISANGSTQGVVWSIDSSAYSTNGAAVLWAHNASNVTTPLYSSAMNASRDSAGPAVKFTVPTVANGKVYVGTGNQIDIYGLLNGIQQTATPVINPGTESFTGTVNVTITDSTAGSAIYYTTDGSAPTPASTLYTSAIAVSSTQTIKAVATANGLLTSATASATYTNVGQANAVVFSLPTGTYTSAQSLTLSDATAGATIYYTVDGTTPTTASTVYTSAITISATETVTVIAVAPGVSNSPVIANTYTIQLGGTGISFSQGFAASAGILLTNGSAGLNDSRLQLTNGLNGQSGTAWYKTPVNVQAFTTDFAFQLSNPAADGITFTIHNSPSATFALGGSGYQLGYGGIAKSVAIKFDLYNSAGEGPDSTGLYTNGVNPTVPAIDLSTTGINLHSDDEMAIHLVYDGTTLTMTITDMVTAAVWSTSWTINIPSIVGANTAYVGFTGSTGGATSSQKILTWTYASSAPATTAATPTFSPAAGTYTTAQNVTISDVTSGATIYYTTDGSAPTTASNVYSTPISVSTTETVKAIAAVAGSSSVGPSSVATAVYTITPPAATPTFSLAAGSYTSAQTVTLSDTTAGAVIYYTTDGSTPTSASTLYSGAISVTASETIKAIATATGFSSSSVASAAYTITTAAATPTFSPAAGTYTSTQTVSISDATTGATIYYTLDGSSPTTASAVYAAPLTVSATTTIKALAAVTGSSSITPSAVASATFTITPPAATPSFSPAGGTYNTAQTVTLSDSTAAAKIYYTIDGSTPTTASTLYSGAISVTASETIKAIATATGFSTSAVGTAAYTISSAAAAPAFSPAPGTYSSTQSVVLSDATAGTTIYYTTDGSSPTTASAVYSGPISVSATTTIKALATGSASSSITPSAVATGVYTIGTITATPTFSPAPGSYSTAKTVTLSDSTAGAAIYYTTDGTTPTVASPVYSGPITVSATTTIKAVGLYPGLAHSPVATGIYTIAPRAANAVFSPAAGSYVGTQTVTLSDSTPGATIYYTNDGTTPTSSSTLYTGPITVSASQTLKSIAFATGYTGSGVTTAAYTITAPTTPAATPTFSLAGGTYTGAQTVNLSDASSGVTIYYTTDGSTPTSASTAYSGAITVSATETINAIALGSAYLPSSVATASYTISSTAPTVNFPNGFTLTSLNLNNGVTVVGGALQLTDGGAGEARTAWYATPLNIQKFTTDFNFQFPTSNADGFTFAIQNAAKGPYALGGNGSYLGYGGIGTSVAVKFDLYSNAGEGNDSTGTYTNGVIPTLPSVDMTSSGLNLHSGNVFHAHITYDGTTLTVTITDTVTNATFTTSSAINIPAVVGKNTAYVGFTAGTGGLTATQNLINWTYTVN